MTWYFRKTEDVGELMLSGEVTVSNAVELRSAFSRSLADVGRLVIHVEEVKKVDISFMQLLCSTHRTARMLMKEIGLVGRSPAFFNVAEESGFARNRSCPLGELAGCIWTDEESVNRRS